MNHYIGTKAVNATPMTRGAYNTMRGWKPPEGEDQAVDGYLVEYTDGGTPNHPGYAGYISWSPKEQFDNAYRPTSGLTFGLALEALKQGKKLARVGWNGKGMFVYYVPAAAYKAQTGVAKSYFGVDAMVPYAAYLAIKNIDGTVSTWVPSINDCLSEDWQIV